MELLYHDVHVFVCLIFWLLNKAMLHVPRDYISSVGWILLCFQMISRHEYLFSASVGNHKTFSLLFVAAVNRASPQELQKCWPLLNALLKDGFASFSSNPPRLFLSIV